MTLEMNTRFRNLILISSLTVSLFCISHVPASGEDSSASLAGINKGYSSGGIPDYIRKRPYLIYSGNNTSMAVLWQTYQTPSKTSIEWGSSTSYGKGPFIVKENGDSSDKHQFSYTISNLNPGTKYYYRVTNDAYSYTGSFITAPPAGQTELSFYGYGDSRAIFLNDPVDHNSVLSALLSDLKKSPDKRQTLLVHLGDYVYNGLNEFLWDLQQFNPAPRFNAICETFANLPFMGVLGNHEGYDAYTEKKATLNIQNIGELFRKYYPYMYPDEKRFYYSFDYGPVHFVVIDTWSYPDQKIDDIQTEWLKKDLNGTQKKWKIAMLHTPIWDCRKGIHHIQKTLTPILKAGGVHLVLQGHHHYYSHAETVGEYSGITYLTLGGGGASLEHPESCDPETDKKWPPFAAFKFHFARFDITGNSMTVHVIANDGTEIENFQITNRGN